MVARGETLAYDKKVNRYSSHTINVIRRLRGEGKTYGEIRNAIHLPIPKSSLSDICRRVSLPPEYVVRINKLNLRNLDKGRQIAVEINKIKREQFFQSLIEKNTPIAATIHDTSIGKIALAMLYLGEASKYSRLKTRSFSLGSSDVRIIMLFLKLLRMCFAFNPEKIRATVQCRADQDPFALQQFWEQQTAIPNRLFYKPQIDPRTKGKPTLKKGYHGVLRVDYFDTKVQLELESLADLVYNQLRLRGPVVYR